MQLLERTMWLTSPANQPAYCALLQAVHLKTFCKDKHALEKYISNTEQYRKVNKMQCRRTIHSHSVAGSRSVADSGVTGGWITLGFCRKEEEKGTFLMINKFTQLG